MARTANAPVKTRRVLIAYLRSVARRSSHPEPARVKDVPQLGATERRRLKTFYRVSTELDGSDVTSHTLNGPRTRKRSQVARPPDMNKMLQQVQQMQAEMAKSQEELAKEIVEASVGGGMVKVKATGGGEIVEVKIAKDAIDPDDPESLEDLVVAGVNEALRSAQDLMQSKLGGAMGGLGGLGLPGM